MNLNCVVEANSERKNNRFEFHSSVIPCFDSIEVKFFGEYDNEKLDYSTKTCYRVGVISLYGSVELHEQVVIFAYRNGYKLGMQKKDSYEGKNGKTHNTYNVTIRSEERPRFMEDLFSAFASACSEGKFIHITKK